MKKCIITASSSMTEETFGYLCSRAYEKFGEDTEIIRRTDDSLLGGFIIETGGRVYDLSLSSQLSCMKKHIKEES